MPKDFRKKYTTVGKQTTDKVKKLTTQPNDPLNMGARITFMDFELTDPTPNKIYLQPL